MTEDRTQIDAEDAADELLDRAREIASNSTATPTRHMAAQTFALMAIAHELRASRAVAAETRDTLDAIYGKLDLLTTLP